LALKEKKLSHRLTQRKRHGLHTKPQRAQRKEKN